MAAGRVWVNGIDTDTVSVFDPASEHFRVIRLPSEERRHSQGDHRRAGTLLVYGQPQRPARDGRVGSAIGASAKAARGVAAWR
jgi:sugar lactone lactonase YvrE